MRVLVACEFSGIVRDAFLVRGHDAWSADLLETERLGPHIQQDVLEILDDKWTAVTKDGMLSAHFEHTVCITESGPQILTAWEKTNG